MEGHEVRGQQAQAVEGQNGIILEDHQAFGDAQACQPQAPQESHGCLPRALGMRTPHPPLQLGQCCSHVPAEEPGDPHSTCCLLSVQSRGSHLCAVPRYGAPGRLGHQGLVVSGVSREGGSAWEGGDAVETLGQGLFRGRQKRDTRAHRRGPWAGEAAAWWPRPWQGRDLRAKGH